MVEVLLLGLEKVQQIFWVYQIFMAIGAAIGIWNGKQLEWWERSHFVFQGGRGKCRWVFPHFIEEKKEGKKGRKRNDGWFRFDWDCNLDLESFDWVWGTFFPFSRARLMERPKEKGPACSFAIAFERERNFWAGKLRRRGISNRSMVSAFTFSNIQSSRLQWRLHMIESRL